MILIEFFKGILYQDYDKSNHDTSLRKKLLLSPTRVSSSGTTTAVFQPAATDIYLCDKCENEFYSLREVQIHEKKCSGDIAPSPVPPSPDPEPADEDLEPAGQVPFLAYFRLQPAKHTGIEPYMSPRKRSSSPPRKLIGSMFPRFESIPLTSPLGKFLLTNSKLRNKYQASQHLVIRYERHLHATPHTDIVSSRDRCNNRWIVVWRPNKEQQPWCHLYSFTKRQKRERHLTIESGLNWKSRKLLSRCRPVSVVLKRLQKRIVDRVTRLNGPTAPCIDLTDEPQRMFSDVLCNYPETILSSSSPFGITLNGTPKLEEGLRLFYDSNETTLNFGASSSSHPPAVPVSNRHVGITQQYNHWGNEVESSEQDPLAFNPGDIINHDTISILPITPSNLLQNHSLLNTSGNINHSTQRQPNSHYKALSLKGVPAPGPKCSKINRDTLSKRQQVQQTGNTYLLSNSDLLQLTQGNYGVLGKFHTNTSEISVSANNVSGHSVVSNSPQTLNQCQENPSRTCIKNYVPRLHENSSLVLPHTTGTTTPSINSLIEVIDLSSDDDDSGRVKVCSEADHAPSQLDGLSCYPHSGAKMPGSSKSSLPKNGNSHWSSNCKSHCDAGRVGDLATNGQPPNVLKNPASVSQGFNSSKESIPSVQPHDKTTTNSRKRRCEDHPQDYVGRKLVVIDVSNVGMKVVSWENISENEMISITSRPQCKKTLSYPVETSSDRERDVRKHDGIQSISSELDALSDLNQSGAFVNSVRCRPEVSYTEPSNEQKSMLRESKCNDSLSKRKTEEYNAQKFNLETEKNSGSLFKNLVNTVSKGVEFICSLVGSGSVNEVKSVNENRMEGNSRDYSELAYLDNRALKSKVLDSSLEDQVFGDGKSTKVPKELAQLLKDECRELNRNGLGDLRSIDVQNCKLTRRSVERTIPRRANKRQKMGKEFCKSFEEDAENCIVQDNMSEYSAALSLSSKSSDVLLNYMDENGNSPSYSKTKLNKEAQYDIIVNKDTRYGSYSSQMDVSNKHNNNNDDDVNSDNNNVGQFVSGRKDKTFTDHYRGVTNATLINRNRLQGSECNSVHNTLGETGGCVVKSMSYVGRKEPFELDAMRESGLTLSNIGVFESERSSRKEVREGNYNEVEIKTVTISAEHHKETGDPDGLSSLARTLFPSDKAVHSSSSGLHELKAAKKDSQAPFDPTPVIVCSSTSPLLKKVLQGQGPLSERLVSSYDKGKVNLFQGSNTCNEKTAANVFELDNRRKASSIARKKVPISLQDPRTLCHPVSNLSKLNSPSGTSHEVDNVENMPFHKSILSVNRKSKERRSRVSLEPGLNVDELQSSVGANRSSCGFAASESNSSRDKTPKDESISSQSKSIDGIRKKRPLLRELNNLAKDEWKEMQLRGFHPSSLLDLSSEQRCSSEESENEESDDSEMHSKKSTNLKEDLRKDTIRITPKKSTLSRELLSLSKDEWKEVHGTGFHPSEMIFGANNKGLEGDDPDLHERSDPESSVRIQDALVGGNRMEEINSKDKSGESEESRKRKKVSIPRELLNLGKDEWKEMQNTGFHPSDLVGSKGDEVTYFFDESEEEEDDEDTIENDPPHKTLDIDQKKEVKKKKMSRELATLLKDECKELKRKQKGAKEILRVNRRQRRENGVDLFKSTRYPNSVVITTNSDGRTGKEQKMNKYATARNTRSQTNVVSLVEVFTPRDSHRQLLHTETGMCVLNFNLPMIS
ncbi:titin homolog isoform X2 [Palaemon carinicauda]|uniref:titin homolog isoform X2 n=1 Tax=Palaemon carinicauda TaxID=392227 RepID=UPI0035B63E6C